MDKLALYFGMDIDPPTTAPIGSEEKLSFMAHRASLELPLCHPEDNREIGPCPHIHDRDPLPIVRLLARMRRRPHQRIYRLAWGSGELAE